MPSLAALTYGDLPERGEGLGAGHDAVLQFTQEAVTQLARAFVQPKQLADQARAAVEGDEQRLATLTFFNCYPFELIPEPIDLTLRANPTRIVCGFSYVLRLPRLTEVDQRGTFEVDVPIERRREDTGAFRVVADFEGTDESGVRSTLESADREHDSLGDAERLILNGVLQGVILAELRKYRQIDLGPRFGPGPQWGMQVEAVTCDVIEDAQNPQRTVLSIWLSFLDYENMSFARVRQLVEQRLDPALRALAPGGGARVERLEDSAVGIRTRSVAMAPVSEWDMVGEGGRVQVVLKTQGAIAYEFREASGSEWTYQDAAAQITVRKNLEVEPGGEAVLQFQGWGPGEEIELAFPSARGALPADRMSQVEAARQDLQDFVKGLLADVVIPIITHSRKIVGISFLPEGVSLQDGVRVFLEAAGPRWRTAEVQSCVPEGSQWALGLDVRTIQGQFYDLLGEFSLTTSKETAGMAYLASFSSSLSPGRIGVDAAVKLQNSPVEGRLAGYLAVRYDQEKGEIVIDPHLDIQFPWWAYAAAALGALVFCMVGVVAVNAMLAFLGGMFIGVVADLAVLDALIDDILNRQVQSQMGSAAGMLPKPEKMALGNFTMVPRIGGVSVQEAGIVTHGSVEVTATGELKQPLTVVGRKLARGKGKRRPTLAYLMENGALVPTQLLMDSIEAGLEIPGVHLVHCKDGRRYLRGNPDASRANNLANLPLV